jgi:hypothetical protein
MAFTYGQLKQTIQDFTENSETTFVNNIPTFIRLAEEKILQNVQLELFRKTQTANLSSGNKYLNVPSDFLAPFSLSYTANPFPFGSLIIPGQSGGENNYNIVNSMGMATVGIEYDGVEWNTDVFGTGRVFGDITNAQSPLNEMTVTSLTAMRNYIVWKYAGAGRPATLLDDYVTYIEDTLIPRLAAQTSIYQEYIYDSRLMVGTTFMDFKDPSFIREYQNDDTVTGQPKYYALFDNSNFVISPTPDQDYSVQLSYFYRPQSITALNDNQTTWLSTNAETTLLYASLVEANVFMKGEPDVTQSYMMRVSEGIKQIKMLGESKQTTDLYRTGQIVRAKE